jgi:hypothetical protein
MNHMRPQSHSKPKYYQLSHYGSNCLEHIACTRTVAHHIKDTGNMVNFLPDHLTFRSKLNTAITLAAESPDMILCTYSSKSNQESPELYIEKKHIHSEK